MIEGRPPLVTSSTAYILASAWPGTRLAILKTPGCPAVNEKLYFPPGAMPCIGCGTEAPGKASVALLAPVTTAADVRREPWFWKARSPASPAAPRRSARRARSRRS